MNTITQTIAAQIGARAFFMLGTRAKFGDADSLSFDIRGCPLFNRIRVTLSADDTYTVHFLKIRGLNQLAFLERTGVYADGLHQCIEHNTGLALSL